MMSMLRSSFVSLLLLLFSFEHVLSESCQPCGDSQYQMTTPDASFNAGVEQLKCRDLYSIADDRRQGTDVCYLVMNYASDYCNCMDNYNNPAPDVPYYDSTEPCNICGGSNGSNLWRYDPGRAERSVPTSLGISIKCEFLYETALQGAFLPSQCPSVQEATREACGCALRDSKGNAISGSFGFSKLVWRGILFLESIVVMVAVW